MKNSTHYRLRALACALLASAAMLGACDDDDPNDDPDPTPKPDTATALLWTLI